ncbi:unnamed protein product [Phytomonas sp. EM1]|nr:unnamed protein product [Phytomonas sp. EM1]|eukprot:CCW60126.1 unnamed protein product [Phytomonas sp. isolate EM1]
MLRFRVIPRLAMLSGFRMATITPLPMPALSPTMEKGKIVEWCKQVGDPVKMGDTLCKVETDKAVVTYDSTADDGFIARVMADPGKEVAVGETVCLLVEEKADLDSDEVKQWKPEANGDGDEASVAASTPAPVAAAPTMTPASPSGSPAGDRIKASPYAKKLAAAADLPLAGLQGTGGGVNRITAKDVEAALAQKAAAAVSTPPPPARAAPTEAGKPAKPKAEPAANAHFTDLPVSNMRGIIAKRLHQSKNLEIPHYYLYDQCAVDNMLSLIKQLNAKGNGEYKITVNDYIIKAVARANGLVPEVNASWQGDVIRQYHTVDVAVAVATPTGLITPIIFNAHAKGLVQISKDMKTLAKKARENALQPHEFQGGTCSVSNLGATGIPGFSAIINPPQAMILAVGSAKPRPKMVKNEETGAFEMTGAVEMAVDFTASFDHRVVDGAIGAKWFQGFRDAIENPLSLLL